MIVPGSANALMLGQQSGAYTIAKSLRFRNSAAAYLNRTPASASNRTTWTWSAWVKRGSLGSYQTFFSAYGGASGNLTEIRFTSSDTIEIDCLNAGTVFDLITTQVFRDPAAWYHIVYAVDTTQTTSSNRVKLYVNGVQVTAFSTATYPSQNANTSVNTTNIVTLGAQYNAALYSYFDGYMAEMNFIDGQQLTPSSFGANDATTGVWQPKKYTGTYGTNGFYLPFTDTSSASPTGLGKDFSGTSSNVIVGSATNTSTTLTVVSTTGISVGNIVTGTGIPSNTYVTSIGVLQVTLSQAATATTASTNYTFSGNNWTCNNISLTAGSTYDSMTDVPTLTSATVANYCVLNPLWKDSSLTISNGNLNVVAGGSVAGGLVGGTIAVNSGKWYWETTVVAGDNYWAGAIISTSLFAPSFGNLSSGLAYGYNTGGYKYNGQTQTSYGASYTTGDVIGVAFDADAGTLTFYKNNTSQGTAFTGITGTYSPAILANYTGSGGASQLNANFGQQGFTYTPPTGYVALNTYNLPTSTIVAGNKYMDATIYTGTNATQSKTLNFQPDMIWFKARSDTYAHGLFDSVRGRSVGLSPNQTYGESTFGTSSSGNDLASFNSNGFTVGPVQNWNSPNNTTSNPVAWSWNAGSGSTSSNTNGSITSTVSVNATAGFSIVTYTGNGSAGATIGHGLGIAPSFIAIKSRSNAENWLNYHVSLGATKGIFLNLTQDAFASASYFNNTAPTSSVFTSGSGTQSNGSGQTYVAYCWAEIAGFSQFGSYTGNGSADGPFIYTGFRPKYVIVKRSNDVSDWIMFDTTRSPYNAVGNYLYADLSQAEDTASFYDILSNGFKARYAGGTGINANGSTYIYAAFAENPFKNALAR